jgi:crotonobetainyl-CoA:carnitine CoA-transferase CaiB-like acyl-CoA transferase
MDEASEAIGPVRAGPLVDVTVIDCTQALAGPFGTALLADLGADVIKVENPGGGDGFRPLPPHLPDYAPPWSDEPAGIDYGAPFAAVNRNKRSIVVDLKSPEGREALLRLCEQADAVVENMRAGVMDSLGLGYETIAERNPAIVYGAVRGFGDPRTGQSPYAAWPCLDVAAQSMGGLVESNDQLVTPAVADVYPGTLMALGLVSAVLDARRTGRGRFFDVAMYDSMVTLLRTSIGAYGFSGKDRTRSGRSVLVPFHLFPTSDGRVAIAAPNPKHWEALCGAMGRADLLSDERTRTNGARVRNLEFTLAQVGAWTSSLTKREVLEALGGQVPVGPSQSMAEIFADPHVEARDLLDRYTPPGDNPEVAIGANAIKFAGLRTPLYRQPPRMGEHTAEVFDEFGIDRPPGSTGSDT